MSIDTGAGSEPTVQAPLACVAGAIPPGERAAHFALLRALFGRAARERIALPDGYAFRFDVDAFDDVTRFVGNERRCCPFLTFVLELSQGESTLWLRLTGPAGTREFLADELSLNPS